MTPHRRRRTRPGHSRGQGPAPAHSRPPWWGSDRFLQGGVGRSLPGRCGPLPSASAFLSEDCSSRERCARIHPFWLRGNQRPPKGCSDRGSGKVSRTHPPTGAQWCVCTPSRRRGVQRALASKGESGAPCAAPVFASPRPQVCIYIHIVEKPRTVVIAQSMKYSLKKERKI